MPLLLISQRVLILIVAVIMCTGSLDAAGLRTYDLSLDNFSITMATAPAPPTVVTNDPTQVQSTSVEFNGNINPNGNTTSGWFEWGLAPTFGNTTAPQSKGSGVISVPIAETVTGLAPNSMYQYRAVGNNVGGTTLGNILTTTTLAIPPGVTTGRPTIIGLSNATLKGSVNPNNSSTSARFEWGVDTTYGNFTSSQSMGSGTTSLDFTQALSGLSSSTTYHYRSVCQNSAGTTRGADQIFTTLISLNEYASDGSTIALYHLNESSGTFVQDYSGNELHGTATSENIFGGRYGNARAFNLSTDVVTVANNPLLNPGTGNFTLEAWVTPLLGGGANLSVISKGHPDSANFSYLLSVKGSKQLELILRGTATGLYSVVSVDSPLTDGVWHHVAAVINFDSAKVKLFHNGGLLATTTSGSFPNNISSTAALRLGLPFTPPLAVPHRMTPFASPELFNCHIDEVRISGIARQSNEFNVEGRIRGNAFHDLNANGSRDPGEPVLPNWTIMLGGAASETTQTNSNGDYEFSELLTGAYSVSESLASGWVQTLPPANGSYAVAILAGLDTGGLDFGFFAPSISLRAGWNMFSIPVHVADPRTSILFPAAISNAFSYSATGYSIEDSLKNGFGYWLKFPSAQIAPLPGSPILTDTIPVTTLGWNLIGSITNPIPTTAVITIPPGSVTSAYYRYDGSYISADTIQPGLGYWVKLNALGSIIFSNNPGTLQRPGGIASDLSDVSYLTFIDADGHHQTLYLAGQSAIPSIEQYEAPPLPPLGAFDIRFSTQRYAESLQFGHAQKVEIATQSVRFPVTLRWHFTSDIPEGELESGAKRIRLAGDGTLTLSHASSSRFVLHYNGMESRIPREFSLDQNYPNPFNPSTTITYSLPATQHVRIVVFDILGREITTLVDNIESPGTRTVEFNATSLPSGLYFYRIVSAQYNATKAMIVGK